MRDDQSCAFKNCFFSGFEGKTFLSYPEWNSKLLSTSVTRWLYYSFKIRQFRTIKIVENYKIFAKVGSQFCQILNSCSRNGQKLFKVLSKWRNFAKSGHTALDLLLEKEMTLPSCPVGDDCLQILARQECHDQCDQIWRNSTTLAKF